MSVGYADFAAVRCDCTVSCDLVNSPDPNGGNRTFSAVAKSRAVKIEAAIHAS